MSNDSGWMPLREARSRRTTHHYDAASVEVRRPWERLPQESSAAYLRFRRFRDLDPAERTVRAAAGA